MRGGPLAQELTGLGVGVTVARDFLAWTIRSDLKRDRDNHSSSSKRRATKRSDQQGIETTELARACCLMIGYLTQSDDTPGEAARTLPPRTVAFVRKRSIG